MTDNNVTEDTFGKPMTTQEYDIGLMRGHLIHCLEQNEMSPFPARSRKSSFADGVPQSILLLRHKTTFKVGEYKQSSCQMPEEGQVQYMVSPFLPRTRRK